MISNFEHLSYFWLRLLSPSSLDMASANTSISTNRGTSRLLCSISSPIAPTSVAMQAILTASASGNAMSKPSNFDKKQRDRMMPASLKCRNVPPLAKFVLSGFSVWSAPQAVPDTRYPHLVPIMIRFALGCWSAILEKDSTSSIWHYWSVTRPTSA